MGCVYAYVIILTILGPEYKNRDMRAEFDDDLREAAGSERVYNATHHTNGHGVVDEERGGKM